MTVSDAKKWADFLVKLGCKVTKKYVVDHITAHNMSSEEAWSYFVEQHSVVKESANANRFYKADDVDAYFREVSYAKMRGTYPRRSHGRSFIVPRLKTIRELQNETPAPKEQAEDATATKELVGLRVSHTSFGQGVVTDVTNDGYIVVAFDYFGNKTLSYRFCVEKGVLSFL